MKKLKSLIGISIIAILFVSSCAPAEVESQTEITSEADVALSTPAPYTIQEIEDLTGFNIKEPTYLPENVFFDSVTYENHIITLYFNFGERGRFFQITQTPEADAIPNPTACGVSGNECELIQVGNMNINYRLTSPTETLMWEADGFVFQLFRMSGEPNKIYKDELIKIIASML